MPPSPPHRPTEPPDSPDHDSDSDLDIDLQELDPISAQPPPRSSKHDAAHAHTESQPHHPHQERIPLKALRMRPFRRVAKRTSGGLGGSLGQDRAYSDGQDDSADRDHQALRPRDQQHQHQPHHDDFDQQQRWSDASGTAVGEADAEDEAPLLGGHTGDPRGRNSFSRDRIGRATASLRRLPAILTSSSSGRRTRKEGQGAAAGAGDRLQDEDDDPSTSRLVAVGSAQSTRFPANAISNAKYTPFTFLPVTLYNEFSFFFNMYFLLVALSQAIPALRIGYMSTYVAPLAFVLCITLGKEAYDDIERRRRDNEANSEEYRVLQFNDPRETPSSHAGLGRPKRAPRPETRPTNQSGFQRLGSRDRNDDQHDDGRHGQARSGQSSDDEGVIQSSSRSSPSSVVREVPRKSKDLRVGDVLKLSKGQRVPADVVILQCHASEAAVPIPRLASDAAAAASVTEEGGALLAFADGEGDSNRDDNRDSTHDKGAAAFKGKRPAAMTDLPARDGSISGNSDSSAGETFIRTDQLDGETDWKLRLASPLTQGIPPEEFVRLRVTAGKPDKKVNEFLGTVELLRSRKDAMGAGSAGGSDSSNSAALSVDNTAWANTVIASQGTTLAVILYTGPQTRSALSTSPPRSKTGLLEYEINSLTKILCALTLIISVVLVALQGFESSGENAWYIKIMRFLVLFSTIVPISLRVNLDMGKTAYSRFIQHDAGIPGAVVRTSTIPEDLGRIEYLLSDKTGTLTQNDMEMKKIHVGTVSYANEAMDEVSTYVRQGFHTSDSSQTILITPSSAMANLVNVGTTRTRREIGSRVRDVVLALALCHNVTPTTEVEEDGREVTSYQASSPDEIAIVRWTESVGLKLSYRDRRTMMLASTETGRTVVCVRILDVFPFTSEGKRMGIIVHFQESTSSTSTSLDSGEIWFYQKGADTVMGGIVAANDWLDEETANMAREGLRTLVVGRKKLSRQQYQEFSARYLEASLSLANRDAGMQREASQYLETALELLGVTGVEDRLQRDVKPSLELLRNAGIKIWMLTGDKVETARCVAISAKLVARGQFIYTVARLTRKDNAQEHLDFLRSKTDACLLIDGESLALLLAHFRLDFVSIAVQLPCVVACRCSPTQKAEVARLIRQYTQKRVCCIGDGGNDVSMIQAADVGVGIVGKEGRQASLAADFSIEQFCHLVKLLVWHGRNSYKRSAKLAQFVIHRGLIIAVCQTMFSIALGFEPQGLYVDWLMVGYATVYTAAPVLSLILDRDVDEGLANLYPELYKELTSGRSLSYRTFFVWVLVSVYQGGMIQGLSQILTEVDGKRMVALSYTVLVLNELLMVAIEITTWHPVMIFCILGTFLGFVGSLPFLGRYFDLAFLITWGFAWRVLAIASISLIPPYAGKLIRRMVKPPSYRKVQNR